MGGDEDYGARWRPVDPEALRAYADEADMHANEMREQAVRLWMVHWECEDTPQRISALVMLAGLLRSDAARFRAAAAPVAQTRQPPRPDGGNPPPAARRR